jgi:MtN3 and saliva related transmembrane protein
VIKILGLLAGFLTTLSFLPQVIKSLRTKHMDDFNIWFLILMIIGLSLWTVYGLMIRQLPIIIANIATISLNLILLGLKIKYQKQK